MALGINKLTALQVKKTTKSGYHGDGGGLWLQITKNGGRSWVFRFALEGKTREMGLGPVSLVLLAEARERAIACRKLLAEGIDPIQERLAEKLRRQEALQKVITFAECADAVIAIKSKELKNAKHIAQWRSSLTTYAYPVFGQKPVDSITKSDVLKVIEPIWYTKNETANRVRGRIEAVLDYAKAKELREGDNPAAWKGMLKPLLPAPSKIQKTKHHKALDYRELPKFMTALKERKGISARALAFSILTATRSSEVRGAKWSEINLDEKIWIIPEGRMKAGKEHRIPLSAQAVELLQAMPKFFDNELVFVAARGGQLSDTSLTAVLKRMEYVGLTQHGFRSTFRDWAGETTAHPREVIEHALAHQLKDKAEAAYQRGDLLVKRKCLMNDWGTYSEMKNVEG